MTNVISMQHNSWVVDQWLNTTGHVELGVIYVQMHTEIIASGDCHVWKHYKRHAFMTSNFPNLYH